MRADGEGMRGDGLKQQFSKCVPRGSLESLRLF